MPRLGAWAGGGGTLDWCVYAMSGDSVRRAMPFEQTQHRAASRNANEKQHRGTFLLSARLLRDEVTIFRSQASGFARLHRTNITDVRDTPFEAWLPWPHDQR
jgi:hypothetical protein